jgi:peptidoglycan/xylan/chitin deacetylase (PgdA/CDA1 family)
MEIWSLSNSRNRDIRRAWAHCLLLQAATAFFLVFLWTLSASPWAFIASTALLCITDAAISRKLLDRTREKRIPVITYHSITDTTPWAPGKESITLTPALFEKHLRFLEKHNYISLTADELFDQWEQLHTPESENRYCAITFDDGYLDNWLNAFPLLRKYNLKATIFVCPAFVNAASAHSNEDKLTNDGDKGYLTWNHIRHMQSSGLVAFHTHTMSHDRLPAAQKPNGYHHPGYRNGWLFWLLHPDKKALWWRHDLESFAPYGYPLYSLAPALCGPSFKPPKQNIDSFLAWVRNQSPSFFSHDNWQARCDEAFLFQCQKSGNRGTWESLCEYRERAAREITDSAESIARHTGSPVRFLCWPDNHYTPESLEVARGANMAATFSDAFPGANGRADNPARIARMHAGMNLFGVRSNFLDTLAFIAAIRCFEGSYIWYPVRLVASIIRRIASAGAVSSACAFRETK